MMNNTPTRALRVCMYRSPIRGVMEKAREGTFNFLKDTVCFDCVISALGDKRGRLEPNGKG